MKYLIVDDDSTFRERLVISLMKRGDEAIGAASSKEGRDTAKEFNPDRAIGDLRMPGDSGLQLISWLRADQPTLPIVVLTGFGSIATTHDAIRRGAMSYLTKPCPVERVIEAFSPTKPIDSKPLPLPSLDQVEWEHVQRVLADCGGNVTHAAKALGMDRRSLRVGSPKLQSCASGAAQMPHPF